MPARNKLQYRLIFLMVIFSVFLIAAFIVLQLNSKMRSINVFNAYRAKLGALIAKKELISIAPEIKASDPGKVETLIGKTLEPFVASGIVGEMRVISKNQPLSAEDKKGINEIEKAKHKKLLFCFIDKKRRKMDIFISFLPDDSYVVKLEYSLGNIGEALREVYYPAIVTALIVIVANILFAGILSRIMISPVSTLHKFTKVVAGGDLDSRVMIRTDDELQDLGDAFNNMTGELKKMKAKAENANPLTKLPGNIVIMEEVEKRIQNGEKFAVLYSDLDNFKAFNDKYGIHKGDEAIKMAADVMKEAVGEKGNESDLIGHEGGDDFVIVTTPQKAESVAKEIINKFDSGVKNLYDRDDLQQGFFVSHDRKGGVRKFPIMGISLAGVTNQRVEIKSYGEVTNICAEVKKKAKSEKGSAYWIDHRE